MKLIIQSEQTIKDLKKQFHELFPYLKIEFFKEAHNVSRGSDKASMYGNDTQLSSMTDAVLEGSIEFTAATTVQSFEQMMDAQFGLHVQVFRKSGSIYLETTNSDDWSIGQQNAEGKAASENQASEAPRDLTDRDQWE
jgi:hypothetical protein